MEMKGNVSEDMNHFKSKFNLAKLISNLIKKARNIGIKMASQGSKPERGRMSISPRKKTWKERENS